MKKIVCIKFDLSQKRTFRFLADERFGDLALKYMKTGKNMSYLMYDVERKQSSYAFIMAVKEVKTAKVKKELQFHIAGKSEKFGMTKYHFGLIAWPIKMETSEVLDLQNGAVEALNERFQSKERRLYRKNRPENLYEELKQDSHLKLNMDLLKGE